MKQAAVLCALAGATVAVQAFGEIQVRQRVGTANFGQASTLTCGGVVNIQLDGDPTTSAIDLVSAGSVVLVHIYDTSATGATPADEDLGKIVLSIPAGSGMPREVRVLISAPSFSTWDDRPSIEIAPPGFHNWAGITVDESNLAGLTDRVVVRADLSGSFIGVCESQAVIDVGSVVRLVANQFIEGTVRGRRNHVPVPGNFDTEKNELANNALGVIQASRGVAGNFVAGDADPLFGTQGDPERKANIFTIRAGPYTPAGFGTLDESDGIVGKIWARKGVVKNVFTTGKLGDDTTPSEIIGGNGVWVVRGASEEYGPLPIRPPHEPRDPLSTGDYVKHQQDFQVTITANEATAAIPESERTIRDGAIRLIETRGSLLGSITADNLFWNAGRTPFPTEEFAADAADEKQKGILLGGDLGTELVGQIITIGNVMEQCDIVFRNAEKSDITIGWSARGSIVGQYDINKISVGMSSRATEPLMAYPRGFRGSGAGPVYLGRVPGGTRGPDDVFREHWLDRPLLYSSTFDSFPGYIFDGGSLDSVIQVNYVTTLDVWGMRQDHRPFGKDNAPNIAANKPRIEILAQAGYAPRGSPLPPPTVNIGSQEVRFHDDELDSGGIQSGVIWSGNIDYQPNAEGWRVPVDVRTNNYVWANVKVAGVGRPGDIWLDERGIPELLPGDPEASTTNLLQRFMIGGDMNGELHFRKLDRNFLTWIYGAMGDDSRPLILDGPGALVGTACNEQSPRGTRTNAGETAVAERGAVLVYGDPDTIVTPGNRKDFAGQIVTNGGVVNSIPPDSEFLAGDVAVGLLLTAADQTTQASFWFAAPPLALPTDRFPYYERSAADVATGLAITPPNDFNGGATGLAAYGMHGEDSVPANPRAWQSAPPALDSDIPALQVQPWAQRASVGRIRTRFYGPIDINCQTDDPGNQGIRVEKDEDPLPEVYNWIDVTDQFKAVIYSGDPAGQTRTVLPNLDRDLFLRPAIDLETTQFADYAGTYRISRSQYSTFNGAPAARLVSQFTGRVSDLTDDARVQPFYHYFRLEAAGGPYCSGADVAGPNQSVGADGFLTADDIIVFLAWFFANDIRADIAGPNQSTFPDGAFTADDIIVFLSLYFGGCSGFGAVPGLGSNSNCGGTDIAEEGLAGGSQARGRAGGSGEIGSTQPNRPTGIPVDTAAQRIASLQAMIAAETDPQRRAVLQAALAILQAAPAAQPVSDDR